jgi:hypothetical protein
MKPLICRVCGKAEWNHVCLGSAPSTRITDVLRPRPVGRVPLREPVAQPRPVEPEGKRTVKGKAAAEPIPGFAAMSDEEFMAAYRPYQREYIRRYRKRKDGASRGAQG